MYIDIDKIKNSESADIEVDGILKNSSSTFYPENFTVHEVIDLINEASTNKRFIGGNFMYSFREIVFDNGEKELAIDFHDKDKEILSVFLFVEIDDFPDRIINIIDKVLNKESSYEKFVGNVCRVEVSPHTAKISDIFDINAPCEIETKELRNLIDIWLKKLEEFNKTGEV